MGGEDGLEEEETGEREVYVCSSDHDIMCEIRKAVEYFLILFSLPCFED